MQTEQQFIEQIERTVSNAGVGPSPLLSGIFRAQRRSEQQYRSWITNTSLEALLVAWQANEAVAWDMAAVKIARRLLWNEFSRRNQLLLIMTEDVKAKVAYLLQVALNRPGYPAASALGTMLPNYATADLKQLWDAMDHYHPDAAGSVELVEAIHAEMNRRGEGHYVAV